MTSAKFFTPDVLLLLYPWSPAPPVPYTGVEGDVIKKPGIDEAHGEVRHPGQLDAAVDVAVDLGRNRAS